jgi:hypothetical protein
MIKIFIVLLFAVTTMDGVAANYPCSKGKGGVSHCQGQKFVCNDGSVSQSKRACSPDNVPSKVKKTTAKKFPSKDKK